MDSPHITVKEIARLAGVSIGTVDRVLHARGGVSEETKARIDSIIGSFEYKPNFLARQLSLNKTFRFRVVLPRADQDSGYWSLCLSGIRRAARDLAPYGARIRVDEVDRYDRAAYRSLLEEIVQEPGDGLLFAPFLPDELVPALRRIEGRAPYAFFDGSIDGTDPLAVVAQDAYRGGYLAGRVMSLFVGGGRPLLALGVHAEVRHIGYRLEGFRAFFTADREAEGIRDAKNRGTEIRDAKTLGTQIRDAKNQGAKIREILCPSLEKSGDCDSQLQEAFADQPDIAGILVANSAGHLVGDWLAEQGRRSGEGKVALVSWDLVPDNARALEEGRIDCVLSQRPADQAREALERLVRAVIHATRDATHGVTRGGAVNVARGAGFDDTWADIPLEVYFKENLPSLEGGNSEPGIGSRARQEAR